jgi:phage terminase small subunit
MARAARNAKVKEDGAKPSPIPDARWIAIREAAEEMLKERADGAPVEGLTERERRFAEAYVEVSTSFGKDFGMGPIAYRRAFPLTEATDTGIHTMSRVMLVNDRVIEYIGILRHELTKRSIMPLSRLVQEMESIAYANILDYVRIDVMTGEPRVDLRSITPQQASAIKEIIIEDTKDGGRRTKLRLFDKQRAHDMLNRIHGAYNDKVSLSITTDVLDRLIIEARAKLIEQGVDPKLIDQLLIEGTATDVTEEVQEAQDDEEVDTDTQSL